MRWLPLMSVGAVLVVAASVTACATNVGYYAQAAGGHLRLMAQRKPIWQVLEQGDIDPDLRIRLETLLAAREFAVGELALPKTGSYKTYVETGRRAITWNVVAAEEFSLRPHLWCFPVAGCVSYRGYFEREDADEYAEDFRNKGFDVSVGGAIAYSTLGWFDDPVLDTMLRGSDTRYIGTLFHEMAHQRLYQPDDSDFNEAYATFVEEAGVRLWLQSRDESARIAAYDDSLVRAADFTRLIAQAREDLIEVYSSDVSDDEKRAGKRAAIERMRERYEALKASSWGGYEGYDGWFRRDINNARLVAVSTYRRYLPAFAVLFRDVEEDIPAFHQAAEQISNLPADARNERMEALLARAAEAEA